MEIEQIIEVFNEYMDKQNLSIEDKVQVARGMLDTQLDELLEMTPEEEEPNMDELDAIAAGKDKEPDEEEEPEEEDEPNIMPVAPKKPSAKVKGHGSKTAD